MSEMQKPSFNIQESQGDTKERGSSAENLLRNELSEGQRARAKELAEDHINGSRQWVKITPYYDDARIDGEVRYDSKSTEDMDIEYERAENFAPQDIGEGSSVMDGISSRHLNESDDGLTVSERLDNNEKIIVRRKDSLSKDANYAYEVSLAELGDVKNWADTQAESIQNTADFKDKLKLAMILETIDQIEEAQN